MSDSIENKPQEEAQSSPEEADKQFVQVFYWLSQLSLCLPRDSSPDRLIGIYNLQPSQQEIEKLEEAKLKARYPKAMQPMSGHSAFLQKRLAGKGVRILFV